MPIAYELSIGAQTLASAAGPGRDARPIVALHSDIGVGGSAGQCLVRLGDVSWADPQIGDPIEVALDAGDGAQTVFTGEVEEVAQRADALLIRACDGLARLARTEVEGAYEEVSAGTIVKDLIAQAGAQAGDIEDGPTFPSYVLHRGPRALRHARGLAELVGAELATDGAGKIHFRRPAAGAPAHRFVWAQDLIELDLTQRAPVVDSFAVWGEGAAGTQGAERSHWLPTDLAGVSGQAAVRAGTQPGAAGTVSPGSTGALVRTVIDGAVRSAETAGDLAGARANLVALRPLAGHVQVLGRPGVQPGDWIELADLPGQGGQSLTLRARRVIHELTMERGLLTRLEM